jgi:hypothetical protein
MYQVSSIKYQVASIKYQVARGKRLEPRRKSRLRLDFFAPSHLCERKEEKRKEIRAEKPVCRQEGKRQEPRAEKQEPRAEKQESFAVRFLCGFAPLREKRKKRQVSNLIYLRLSAAADRSLQLCERKEACRRQEREIAY